MARSIAVGKRNNIARFRLATEGNWIRIRNSAKTSADLNHVVRFGTTDRMRRWHHLWADAQVRNADISSLNFL
jgi:hypothetical protein